MFSISLEEVKSIIRDFNVGKEVSGFSELQRYHYEKYEPESLEVRLIVKVNFSDESAAVIRFKNEVDVTETIMENQARFAQIMRDNEVETPLQYSCNGKYTRWYTYGKYTVLVTVEDFVDGEVKLVDKVTAEKTGALLANMHNISQENNLHVENEVLFDVLMPNDLLNEVFVFEHEEKFLKKNPELYENIKSLYNEYIDKVKKVADDRYAVQGDISDCNLYITNSGELGIFDYNRCGNNSLFVDAIMQAVFEARLMDYSDEGDYERTDILNAFFTGYHHIRPFTEMQREVYPYLKAIIDAFWNSELDSLVNAEENNNDEIITKELQKILRRLRCKKPLPV